MGEKGKRVAEKTKDKPKEGKKRIGLKIFLVVLLILIAAAALFTYRVYRNGWGMQGLIATTLGHDINTLKNLEPVTFVLIGESDEMSDTILLCSYNPQNGKASMMSIARDTFTGSNPDTAKPYHRINSLFQESPEKLVEAVAKVTGVDVTNYIVIDTKALVKLVDTIGGVWYNVPMDMDYDDETQGLSIDLKAGEQKLNGIQAEGLVRFRHDNEGNTYPYEYGGEDHGRNRTQREFIKEVLKQSIKFNNIFKLGEFYDIFKEYVKTNMDLDVMKDYLPYVINLDTESILADRIPGRDVFANNETVWIFLPNKKETEAMVKRMFIDIHNDNPEEESTELKIEVFNASGDSNKLASITEKLSGNGYRVMRSTQINETPKTVVINRTGRTVEEEASIIEAIGTRGNTTRRRNCRSNSRRRGRS